MSALLGGAEFKQGWQGVVNVRIAQLHVADDYGLDGHCHVITAGGADLGPDECSTSWRAPDDPG